MPKVKVECQSALSPDNAFQKVSEMLENDGELKRLDPGFATNFDSQNLKGHAKGRMFSAQMSVSPNGDGCRVEITVDLPLALTLAKGSVEKTLRRKLEKALS